MDWHFCFVFKAFPISVLAMDQQCKQRFDIVLLSPRRKLWEFTKNMKFGVSQQLINTASFWDVMPCGLATTNISG
jgi:hypothetical protein